MPLSEKELFTPINNRRAFEQVSTKIKELIFRGVLKPGDKLPSETHLAAQFNVGRQTIREALRLLELSGFIVIQKGGTGGPEIVNTVLNRIRDLFLDAFRIKNISMKDLTVARLEIEKVVLLYAMLNMDESDIQSQSQYPQGPSENRGWPTGYGRKHSISQVARQGLQEPCFRNRP